MSEELVLIDGTNYAFRAFFAMPPMSTSSGFPTGALFGFSKMLLSYLLGKYPPSHIAVAFDPPAPSFRKTIYPEYKAQRKPVPQELLDQLPHVRRLTEALGVRYFEVDGFEADDIIATIATRTAREGVAVRIVSTDKDLMQLVSERVVTEDTIRGVIYDRETVEDKWGVPPERLRDLFALQGDSSDNIPGVPGIGPKKARALLEQFETVPNLLAQVDRIENARIRKLVEAHRDAVELSYRLVALRTDVPIEYDLSDLRLIPPRAERYVPVLKELEFRTLIREIEEEERRIPEASVVPVRGGSGVAEVEAAMAGAETVGIETVVTDGGSGEELSLFLSTEAERVWQVVVRSDIQDAPEVRWVRSVLSGGRVGKVGHDLKRVISDASRFGLSVRALAGDTMVAAYLLDSSKGRYPFWKVFESSTDCLCPRVLMGGMSPQQAACVLRVHDVLAARLEQDEMMELYRRIELPLIPVLERMERWGIRVDVARLRALSKELGDALSESEARIHALAEEPVNPASPKQLQRILFDKLKLRVVKKTKTGPSTDQSVLEELASEHPLPAEILKFRSIAKLKNTYVDPLPELVDPVTSRIHTSFNQTVTATGRLSSSDPNLQNIPVREEEGRRIREAFVAEPGYRLLSADYSQIELRLLAHFSGDQALNDAFSRGLDVHAATAAEVFGVPLDLVTPQMRRSAKAINFGIVYGMGPYRLARDLRISRKEAKRHIERYFERYGGVRAYLDETLAKGRERGYVTTLFKRRRYLPELRASSRQVRQAAERMAINMPIQGSAADIIKLAMIAAEERLNQEVPAARLLLQVHDELVLEVPEDQVERTAKVVRECMENVVRLKCPLVVDVGHGANWAEAH